MKKFKLEADLRDYCMGLARGQGILAWHFKSLGKRGVPDIVLIFPGGSVVFVEFKHPNGDGVLSENQVERIKELRAQRADVYTCDNVTRFIAIMAAHI